MATYRVTDDGGCDGGSRRLMVARGDFLLLLLAAVVPLSPFSWLPATSPPFSFSLWFSLGFPFLFFSFFPFFLSFLFSLGGFLVKSSIG